MYKSITKTLGFHRGNRRFYEDNAEHIKVTGFEIGDRLSIEAIDNKIIITKSATGKNSVSIKQGSPVIDINNSFLTQTLGNDKGEEQVTYQEHQIIIEKKGVIAKAAKRLAQTTNKLKKGLPLAIASLYTGLGMLDLAASEGLATQGIISEHVWVNEYEPKIVEHAVKHNKAVYEQATVINSDIRDFNAHNLQKPDILLIGQPCVTQSSLNTNKEQRGVLHDQAGDLFFHSLRIINECNPSIIVLENSPNFIKNDIRSDNFNAQTVEFYLFKKVLESMDYDVSFTKVSGGEINMLEKRERTCFVATTKGLPIDINQLQLNPLPVSQLGDYLDRTIRPDSSMWKPYTYLENNNKNTNFKAIYNKPTDTSTGTLTATYAKVKRDTCILIHPSNPSLKRILTPAEHARIKGFDAEIVADANVTLGHRMLGNGIQKPVWSQVFSFIGDQLKTAIDSLSPKSQQPINGMSKQPMQSRLSKTHAKQLDLFAA